MTIASVTPAHPVSGPATVHIPGLVWAFRIHESGMAEPLPINNGILLHNDSLTWLHLNLADARCLQWLQHMPVSVPSRAKALLMSREAFQQLHSAEDCISGVLTDVVHDLGEATDQTSFLRFLLTERVLISGRHQPLCAADLAKRSLEAGKRIGSPALLLEMIVEHVADTMEAMADRIALSLDAIEENVTRDSNSESLKSLGQIRRTCVRLHRQLSGMKAIFTRLEQTEVTASKAALQLNISKLVQRLSDLDHRVVEMRERSRLLQEELHLQIGEQTNESLRVLSVLTALLLPPTLVTGIFGMNTKGLPFTDNEFAFVWASVLLIASSLSAYAVLRRLNLIR